MKNKLFGNLNFKTIASNPDFKEDSVREVIILPIIKELGYTQENIVRSKTLQHPFLKIATKKRPIHLIPDYAIKIEDKFAWVLDAKAPNQKIINDENVEQVYCYASHPDIRSNYFALCNGLEFSVFKTLETNKPILFFNVEEIETYWEVLKSLLSPDSFQIGKRISYEPIVKLSSNFIYNERPLLEEIPVQKRANPIHFGVHGYFTKQTWNVVAEYIKNFTKVGDLVLDPFGGSGVTAIEALMNNRKAINVDINPMAVFLVESLIAPVNISDFNLAFKEIKEEYLKNEPKTDEEIKKALKKYPGPKPLSLPKGSDVDTVDQLFTDKQKAQLGLLKSLILKYPDANIRKSLLLVFSGTLTRINLTYHVSNAIKAQTGFGGDAAAFRYYRYRIAKIPTDINVLKCFKLRFDKVKNAKKKLEYNVNEQTISNAQIIKGTATDLSFIAKRIC